MSTRTIALTLRPTSDERDALARLQRCYNAACNYISQAAWDAQEFNKVRLQRLVYDEVRAQFGLMAQHVIRAIAVVAASYQADKKGVHAFREDAAVCLDTPRLYRIVHNRASITTLDGRLKVQLGIGGHQRQMLKDATKLAEADLLCDKKGRWRLLVSAHYADPPTLDTAGVLGVDLGRADIAHTSKGERWSGAHLTAVRDRYARNRRDKQRRPFMLVNPRYSSQMCHRCLHMGERTGKRFRCPACGRRGDADYNGARNIALLGQNVMLPRGPWLCCADQPGCRAPESPRL